jgi:hypothetical protein
MDSQTFDRLRASNIRGGWPSPQIARRLQVLIQNGFKLGAAARLAVANGRTVLLAAQILSANSVY